MKRKSNFLITVILDILENSQIKAITGDIECQEFLPECQGKYKDD